MHIFPPFQAALGSKSRVDNEGKVFLKTLVETHLRTKEVPKSVNGEQVNRWKGDYGILNFDNLECQLTPVGLLEGLH